jgi:hypothetical protein
LFDFFKTVPSRMYEAALKRWSFELTQQENLINGIKKVAQDNDLIILF